MGETRIVETIEELKCLVGHELGVEIEGEERPAMVAETIGRVYL